MIVFSINDKSTGLKIMVAIMKNIFITFIFSKN